MTQKSLIERFKTYLEEGEVYHFEDFKVIENKNDFSVTDSAWKLELYLATLIKPSPASIDPDGFNFVSVKDISDRVAQQSS